MPKRLSAELSGPGKGKAWGRKQKDRPSAAVHFRQLPDPGSQFRGQILFFHPPFPVIAVGGRFIDSGAVIQSQIILHGNDAVICNGGKCRDDQLFHDFQRIISPDIQVLADLLPLFGQNTVYPSPEGLIVMCPCLHHTVGLIAIGQVLHGSGGIS